VQPYQSTDINEQESKVNLKRNKTNNHYNRQTIKCITDSTRTYNQGDKPSKSDMFNSDEDNSKMFKQFSYGK
jgi:hypothetical protein